MGGPTLRARLAVLIRDALSLAGTVHASVSRLESDEDVAALLGATTSTDGLSELDGWIVFPGQCMRADRQTRGYTIVEWSFQVFGYRMRSDTSVSTEEAAATADAETVQQAIQEPTALQRSTDTGRAHVTDVSYEVVPTRLAGVDVWETVLEVRVTEYVNG